MDNDRDFTPTQPLPLQPEVAAPIPNEAEPHWLKSGYRFVVIVILLVGAVVLGTFVARWIVDSQVEKVFPTAPSVVTATECGVEPTVTIPEVEGVAYDQSRSADVLTVKAAAVSDRYELIGGAATSWDISMAPVPCPEPTPEDATTGPEAPGDSPTDHVGEFIDGAKEAGSEVWDWTKEYGPGIWDRVKELGNGAKESVEEWSRGNPE